jgi:hypothetical protein
LHLFDHRGFGLLYLSLAPGRESGRFSIEFLFRRRRRNNTLVGDLRQLFDHVFEEDLAFGGLIFDHTFWASLVDGCGNGWSLAVGPSRAVVPDRSNSGFLGGFLEIDLFFILHELGEVRDIEEGIAFEPDVDEGRLHSRQDLHNAALVEVPDNPLILIVTPSFPDYTSGDSAQAHLD